MICPACHHVMIVVEYQRIELDYCPNCNGAWFDAGEMELLLERVKADASLLSLKQILASPEALTSESKRKCPLCRDTLKKVHVGEKPSVLIDACPRGEGLWFDGGEVTEIVKQCATSCGTETVFNFMGDTLKSAHKPQ